MIVVRPRTEPPTNAQHTHEQGNGRNDRNDEIRLRSRSMRFVTAYARRFERARRVRGCWRLHRGWKFGNRRRSIHLGRGSSRKPHECATFDLRHSTASSFQCGGTILMNERAYFAGGGTSDALQSFGHFQRGRITLRRIPRQTTHDEMIERAAHDGHFGTGQWDGGMENRMQNSRIVFSTK